MTHGKPDSDLVRAEVLLRAPQPAAFDKIVGALRQRGIEVTARGAASLSIRCPRPVFERVFGTALRPTQQGPAAEGVRDFGVLKHTAYEAEKPATVPAELAAEVEGVYLQGPPRLC
jgi:hypothetical protein